MPPNQNIKPYGENGWIVHPTGTHPADWTNVQWAVDNVGPGGSVLLTARALTGELQFFHFGDDQTGKGAVNITRDVSILGDAMPPTDFVFPNGKTPDLPLRPDRTVVYGGQRPFRCGYEHPIATRLAVRDIYFAYPWQSAVHVKKSSGLDVSNCVVYDVKKAATDIPGLTVAIGIEATGLSQKPADRVLNGEFRAVNNIVKRSEDLDYEKVDSGIVVQFTNMQIHIQNNTISAFAHAGIGLDGNTGPASIERNTITYCGYGTVFPQSGGIGIKRSADVPVTIKKNTVVAGAVAGPHNTVLTSMNGITLWGASRVTVSDNTVKGTVLSSGILLTSAGAQHSTGNSIKHNDLKHLVAGHAQALYGQGCDTNASTHNDFGPVDLIEAGVAGIVVHSNDNKFTNETFWGDYPGTSGTPRVPCVWLMEGTRGNKVTALKRAAGSPAFDLCSQVQDDGESNDIPGYQKCPHVTIPEIGEREKKHVTA